ncbi:hypothetical protein LguiA_029687 [Lonicera macranthoides]
MMHFGCLLNNNDNSTAVPDYDSQFDHNELNTLVINLTIYEKACFLYKKKKREKIFQFDLDPYHAMRPLSLLPAHFLLEANAVSRLAKSKPSLKNHDPDEFQWQTLLADQKKRQEKEKAIKNNELGATAHIDATAAFNQSTYDNEDNNDDNQGSQSITNFTAAHLELQQFIQLCAQVLVQAVGYFCFVGSSLAFCPALFSLPVLAFLLLFCEFSWWTLVLRTRSVSWTSVMSGLAVNGSADDALPQALLSNARRSRSVNLDRAYEFIKQMPTVPDVVIWRMLLSS